MADNIEVVGMRTGYVEGTSGPVCFAGGYPSCCSAEMEILANGQKLFLNIGNCDGDTINSGFFVTEESCFEDSLHPEDEERFDRSRRLEQDALESFGTISEAYENSKYDRKLWKKLLKEFAKEMTKMLNWETPEKIEKDFEDCEV